MKLKIGDYVLVNDKFYGMINSITKRPTHEYGCFYFIDLFNEYKNTICYDYQLRKVSKKEALIHQVIES